MKWREKRGKTCLNESRQRDLQKRHCSMALREMKLHLEQEKEEVTWRWVRCGGSWEVGKPLKPSRGWVGLKPHCKPFFPLRQAELEGQDGTGLQGRTRGHFITESVCPEDGKRIILQTGFIGGDNSLAEPTVGKRHIGWGYNIASFTASNRLISSNVCVCVCVFVSLFRDKWMCVHVGVSAWVCVRSVHLSAQGNTEKLSCHRHCDMISSSSYRLHYEAPRDDFADLTDSRK